MTTICLNMIVKNEAHCIERCLKSLVHLIDYYVIIDTGSTDATPYVISKTMTDAGIRGEIHHRPWVDFGFNRTEAIQIAEGRADYLLVIDADDEFQGTIDKQALTLDVYSVMVYEASGILYERTHLFRASSDFKYVGVMHEYLDCVRAFEGKFLSTLKYIRHQDGARWGDKSEEAMKRKHTKDALILENALQIEPVNSRYAFYLGQCWKDAREPEKAIAAYEHRVAMKDGWDEERWYALFMIAALKRDLEYPEEIVINDFLKAYEDRSTRIEPLYELAMYLQDRNRHQLCWLLLQPVLSMRAPNDKMPIDAEAYTWGVLDLFATSAFHVGDYQRARDIWDALLGSVELPIAEHVRVQNNLRGLLNHPAVMFTAKGTVNEELPITTREGQP